MEIAQDKMKRIAKEAAEARNYATRLSGLDFGEKLPGHLTMAAQKLELGHNLLRELVMNDCKDPEQYEPLHADIESWRKFYEIKIRIAKARGPSTLSVVSLRALLAYPICRMLIFRGCVCYIVFCTNLCYHSSSSRYWCNSQCTVTRRC